ncbi:ISAs1 family transposase [Escherichia coli]|nr:ISAs1 family transposase [Escherichia coli]EGR6845133.1 ISAs1 family transposase [Salmonella enterica]EJQ1331115.1 ISAs1 family transposase [Shigella boydii]EFH4873983.1 ISAs1 family transposase [Escherichia coli]EFH7198833.1 ISAs1 family transposase [Escherichia coli]
MDTHYYVSSLEIAPEQVAKAVRQHWHIENQQHWVLDVAYREDASRLGDREAAGFFALFRRILRPSNRMSHLGKLWFRTHYSPNKKRL